MRAGVSPLLWVSTPSSAFHSPPDTSPGVFAGPVVGGAAALSAPTASKPTAPTTTQKANTLSVECLIRSPRENGWTAGAAIDQPPPDTSQTPQRYPTAAS